MNPNKKKIKSPSKQKVSGRPEGNVRSLTRAMFFDDALYSLEKNKTLPVRLIWLALISTADRYGRFVWSRSSLQTLLIEDMSIIENCMDALYRAGRLLKYKVAGDTYGYIIGYGQHQSINCRELALDIPHPDGNNIVECNPQLLEDYEDTINVVGEPVLFKAQRRQRKVKETEKLEIAALKDVAEVVVVPKIDATKVDVTKKSSPDVYEDYDPLKPATQTSLALTDAPKVNEAFTKSAGGLILRHLSDDDLPVVVANEHDFSPSIAIFELNGDIKQLGFSEEMARSFDLAYPGADNIQRIRRSAQWLLANPTRRKTSKGLMRYINTWIAKANDSGTDLIGQSNAVRSNSLTNRFSTDSRVGGTLDAINNMLNQRRG